MSNPGVHKITDKAYCLNCGKRLDGALETSQGRGPKPGDVSVCMFCANVAMFANDMTLRVLTGYEEVFVRSNPKVFETVCAIKRFMKDHPEVDHG